MTRIAKSLYFAYTYKEGGKQVYGLPRGNRKLRALQARC